jgi:3-hydroxyisobutyrate dehydrogenase
MAEWSTPEPNSSGPQPVDDLRVGIVGLGAIGAGVAVSLARRGRLPVVYDSRPDAAITTPGVAEPVTSAADLAGKCDVVLVAVFDEAQVREVLVASDGVLAGARPGLIVVILSTIAVSAVRELADLCGGSGVHLLDCGVTPGDQAPHNAVVALVGGPDDVVTRVMPVLNDFARAVVRCGPTGSGMTLKIARNLVTYCTWVAVDEAATLAAGAGIEADTFLSAMRETEAAHPQPLKMLEVRNAIDRGTLEMSAERANNAVSVAAKDLDAAIRLGAAHGLSLPLADTVKTMIRQVFVADRTAADGA